MPGADYPAQDIAQAYDQMLLYDEHTWGMHSGLQVSRRQDWSWSDKARYAYRAAGLTEQTLEAALRRLAQAVRRPQDGQYIVVFNPLSFPRTDLVRIKTPSPYHMILLDEETKQQFDPENPPEIIDLQTGQPVACQVVEIRSPHTAAPDAPQRFGRGQFHAPERLEPVFVAEQVPPLGWKTFRISPPAKQKRREQKPPAAQPDAAADSGPKEQTGTLHVGPSILENRYFRLRHDPQIGAVQSLYDKQLQREMLDPAAPHRLNQLVVKQVQTARLAEPQKAHIQPGQNGPVYASLVVTTQAPGCPQVTQQIILYEKLKRVDLANRVLRDTTPLLELYFAFPFQMGKPQFAFEASHSVIRPGEDQLPGSNTNYYTMQHWAAVSDGQATAVMTPLEAHLVEFGGLWPCYTSQAHHGVTPPDFGRPFVNPKEWTKGYMYSFAMLAISTPISRSSNRPTCSTDFPSPVSQAIGEADGPGSSVGRRPTR